MYSAPVVTPVRQGMPAKNATLFTIAGATCLAIMLGLIAATIVLALIPLYISNRSKEVNTNSLFSKEAVMDLPLRAADNTGRRRRQDTDFDNLVGAEGGPNSRATMANKMRSSLDATVVDDVEINSMTVAYRDDGKRKRWSLAKRQNRLRAIVCRIKFRLRYKRDASPIRRVNASPLLRQQLITAFSGTVTLPNMDFYRNGALLVVLSILNFLGNPFVSEIVPGTSAATIGPTPTTGQPIVTTNTTAIANTTSTTTTPPPTPVFGG